MTIEYAEVIWIDARSDYTLQEIAELSGLSTPVLEGLTDCGALPTRRIATTTVFEAESIHLARAASRLLDHFELDYEGLAVAVSLLRRVRSLEARLAGIDRVR